MSAESNNLDPLVSLLKSKQNPRRSPDFFNQMSHKIREGIEHPPAESNPTWWDRVAKDIDLKACATGVSVCALMLAGIFYAMKVDAQRSHAVTPLMSSEERDFIAPPAIAVIKPTASQRTRPNPDPRANSRTPVMMPPVQTNSPFSVPSTSLPANYWQ